MLRSHLSPYTTLFRSWLNLSNNAYGGNPGHTFVVPEGELTQTFQIAGRETYLDFDKFAFGLADLYYRVIEIGRAHVWNSSHVAISYAGCCSRKKSAHR